MLQGTVIQSGAIGSGLIGNQAVVSGSIASGQLVHPAFGSGGVLSLFCILFCGKMIAAGDCYSPAAHNTCCIGASVMSRKYSKQIDAVRTCPNPDSNPKCKKIIHYYNKVSLALACKNKAVCSSCSQYGHQSSEETRRKMSLSRMGEKNPFYGKTHTPEVRAAKSAIMKELLSDPNNNPFYGKKHSEASKDKMRKSLTGKSASKATRKKMSDARKGFKWKPESLEKMRATKSTPEFKAKMSARFSGAGNPMYGKPPAVGSGGLRSIGGWYNDVYFRSSSELCFLMAHDGEGWKGAESKRFRIAYVDRHGAKRHYFPDYFVDDILVEVRPLGWTKRDSEWRNAQEKLRAAADYCEKQGWLYVLAEMPMIPKKKVFLLRHKGLVRLNERWEEKYLEWIAGKAANLQ